MTNEISSPFPIDPYTKSIFNRIEPEIRKSLTAAQISAIASAISEINTSDNYRIDWRGSFSLFFARFYFMILVGRDLGIETRIVELERRQRSLLLVKYMGKATIVLLLPLSFLYLLYLLKSALGINLFPNKHLWDFFV
jgi:hypothetical protein